MELEFQDREPVQQEHTTRAKIIFVIAVIMLPFLSSVNLLAIPVYGCCMEGKMSPKMIVVMSVLWVFCAVSWVPYVNLGIYLHLSSVPHYKAVSDFLSTDTRDQVNGVAPLASFIIFCVWGVYIAFRHFAITDSYEAEEHRSDVQRLAQFTLDPPATYSVESEATGEAKKKRKQRTVNNALELYTHLKATPKYGAIAAVMALLLAAGTAAAARIIPGQVRPHRAAWTPINPNSTSQCRDGTPEQRAEFCHAFPHFAFGNDAAAEYLFIFSTIYFCGMFLVFYMMLSFVIVIYVAQMQFIQRVTYAADEKLNVKRKSMDIAAIKLPNPTHLRAWDEVRRVALLEMTNSKSLLNSFFTPTLVLSAVCIVVIAVYLVVSVLFLSKSVGQLAIVTICLMFIFIFFSVIVIAVAKVAQRHMKRHTTIVARNAFDIARELDRMTTNINEGMAIDTHQSKAAKRVVSQALAFTDVMTPEAEAQLDDISAMQQIDRLEDVLHSISSLCTFMVANQPRPLILGIQLRYVRFIVVYVLLISAILIFFALMVAFKNKCHNNVGN